MKFSDCLLVVAIATSLVLGIPALLRWTDAPIKQLHSYSPKFAVGDCLSSGEAESWETPDEIFKILVVGKNKYHMIWVFPKYMTTEVTYYDQQQKTIDYLDIKVPCP